MNASQKMVKCILETSAGRHPPDWTVQGFGMFRLYLSKAIRLHVWDSRFKVENVTTIHNHPWDFESEVISGGMVNAVYSEWEADLPATHDRTEIVCGTGGGMTDIPPCPTILRCNFRRAYLPGETYKMTAEDLHESDYVDGSITLVERFFRENTENALVYVPHGTKWVSAEPRKATLEEINAMAIKALEVLKGK